MFTVKLKNGRRLRVCAQVKAGIGISAGNGYCMSVEMPRRTFFIAELFK